MRGKTGLNVSLVLLELPEVVKEDLDEVEDENEEMEQNTKTLIQADAHIVNLSPEKEICFKFNLKQINNMRNNEIFLMGQSRPLRGMQRTGGWTPETVLEHAFPALETMFFPLHRSQDIFSWDPV